MAWFQINRPDIIAISLRALPVIKAVDCHYIKHNAGKAVKSFSVPTLTKVIKAFVVCQLMFLVLLFKIQPIIRPPMSQIIYARDGRFLRMPLLCEFIPTAREKLRIDFGLNPINNTVLSRFEATLQAGFIIQRVNVAYWA